MPQTAQDSSSALPGPATSTGAFIPRTTSPVQMQNPSPHHIIPSVDEKMKKNSAWKYEGYQEFGRWMASDNDFFLFRRFESLNADTILYLQDRISRLESELGQIHEAIADSKPEEMLMNSSFRWDEQHMQRRAAIRGELSSLLLHYNQYIEAFAKIRARPRAEQRQVDNVVNWLKRRAITPSEMHLVEHESDLITINSRSVPPLGQWLEACQNLHLWRIFKAKHVEGLHVKSASTTYSSNQTFDRFTTFGIILAGLIMLLAPLWWLEYVSSSNAKLGIITGFICVFILVLTTATINRPFEVVATTAAYAAVLMVFMQVGGERPGEPRR